MIAQYNVTDIPESELLNRRRNVQQLLAQKKAEALVLFAPDNIYYLTAAPFIPTERPIAFILKQDGSTAILVPRLEVEYVSSMAKCVDIVANYNEYPGEKHPMLYLRELLDRLAISHCCVCVDSDGYASYFGYEGPALSAVCEDLTVLPEPRMISRLKRIKSAFDLSVIRESVKWGNLAHMLLQEYTCVGLREMEVERRASAEATTAMLKALGPSFQVAGPKVASVTADYRGQIGPASAKPHIVNTNAVFRKGDNLTINNFGLFGISYVRTLSLFHPMFLYS